MSALHIMTGDTTDDRTLDPGHELERLVKLIMPCMSRIVRHAIEQPILGSNDEKLSAFCEPISRIYVMTSRGFAQRVRPSGVFKKKLPKLLNHYGYAAILPRHKREITEMLTALLDKHNNTFPAHAVHQA